MSKFNVKGAKPKVSSPVTTTGALTKTALGATAYERSTQSDLYLLATSNLIDKKNFHEPVSAKRDERFVDLVHQAAEQDPEFVQGLFPWVRREGYMRTVAVMGAAEAAKALSDAGRHEGVEDMVADSLQRADELGEFLAYWFSIAGKAWPRRYRRVRFGVARAATRLINEYSYGKWDSPQREIRFADVISIVHPKPSDQAQADLFRMILERRRGRTGSSLENLPMISAAAKWHELARTDPKDPVLLGRNFVKQAGLTWEDMMSALGSKVDKADIWSAVTPTMGITALMRNLRNMDQAGISDETYQAVARVLSDPERVRKGKVFPFSFLSAHRAVDSVRWAYPLEQGLNASLALVPSLKGRTLILVDRSPSMFPAGGYLYQNNPRFAKDDISLADKAAVFGSALALRAENAMLYEFGGSIGMSWSGPKGGKATRQVNFRTGASLLKVLDAFGEPISGTDIPRAVKETFRVSDYDRVVIITDEQSRPGYLPSNMQEYGGCAETRIDDLIPKTTPVFLWNMAGYQGSILDAAAPNRHVFGGLSDASFKLLTSVDAGRNTRWPWQS